jgi:hypothetical protein
VHQIHRFLPPKIATVSAVSLSPAAVPRRWRGRFMLRVQGRGQSW